MDDAVNFGGIGMVIGHELTHGFDDEGRQFDAQGNLDDWWTPEDAKRFDEREACIVHEYSSFQPAPGVHVNGKLTLGENTADNGGARIALMALLEALVGHPQPAVAGLPTDATVFPLLRPGMVRQRTPRSHPPASSDGSPFAARIPRQRRRPRICPSSRKPFPAKPASRWLAPAPATSGDPGLGLGEAFSDRAV